jgi:hypothetical protein
MGAGKFAEADPLLRRSLKTLERLLGKENKITVGARVAFEELKTRRRLFGATGFKPNQSD